MTVFKVVWISHIEAASVEEAALQTLVTMMKGNPVGGQIGVWKPDTKALIQFDLEAMKAQLVDTIAAPEEPLPDARFDDAAKREGKRFSVGDKVRAKHNVKVQIVEEEYSDGVIPRGVICTITGSGVTPADKAYYDLEFKKRGQLIRAGLCEHDYFDPDINGHFVLVESKGR